MKKDVEISSDQAGPMVPGPSLIAPLIPPPVPDHELLCRIGQGSYGEVWLARNVLGELRAVKLIYRRSFGDNRPFEREFEGIQRYEPISRSHESQVQILHVGHNEAAGYFYYVMELADQAEPGGSSNQCSVISKPVINKVVQAGSTGALNTDSLITDYCPHTLRWELERHGRLPLARCVEIGLALTTALGHLHGHGLVHRDVKPSNIIFVKGRPKLADIGLVTDVGDGRSIVGTEGYLAPEGPGTPQADLYSLGKVLYEISTGRDRKHFPDLPLDLAPRRLSSSLHVGSSALNVERSTSNAQGLTVESKSGGYEPGRDKQEILECRGLLELNEILLKACARDPRQRYPSAEEMHEDLALLQHGQSVKRKRAVERLWATGKRAIIALVALVVTLVTLVFLWRTMHRSQYAGDGPPSTNELANALCAKALLALRGDNYAGFAEAYTNLHRAIALDPNFARPYVGLFELRLREVVPSLGPTSPEEFHSITRKLAELAPDLGVTHCAQSMANYSDWSFPAALEHARQSVKADPNYEVGRLCFNYILTHWGRPIEGRKHAEIARKLAPSKATVYRSLGHTYYMQRDYTNAIALYRQAIGWQSHHTVAHRLIGRAYLALGDYLEAIAYFEQKEILDGGSEAEAKASYDVLRRAFRDGGARGYWQEEWKRTERNRDGEFYRKAVIQFHLGDTNAAFGWLNKSYETRETLGGWAERHLSNLLFDEYWDGVRDDPRFQELLDKIGFTRVNPKLKK